LKQKQIGKKEKKFETEADREGRKRRLEKKTTEGVAK
jgi:hypothetical protein